MAQFIFDFSSISEAYEVLSDPKTKKTYDEFGE